MNAVSTTPTTAPTLKGNCYTFDGDRGNFTIEVRKTILYRNSDDSVVPLTGKPFQVLEYLLLRPNTVVDKHELLAAIWDWDPKRNAHGYHHALNLLQRAVYEIRQALGDHTDYIQTQPGKGYRFTARPVAPKKDEESYPLSAYRVDQATREDIKWAASLSKKVYWCIDVMPKELMLGWYDVNKTGFSILKAERRMPSGATITVPIANLDILPLRPEVMDRFRRGEILELEFKPPDKCLYRASEREQIRDLYVESLAKERRSDPEEYGIFHLLANFSAITRRVADPERVNRIFAIAASKGGKRLLKRLGFSIEMPAAQRKDKHDLHSVNFAELAQTLYTYFGKEQNPDPVMMSLLLQMGPTL